MSTPTFRWLEWSPWVMRAAWILTAVFGLPAIDRALEGRSDAVSTTATVGAATVWLIGVAAMAIPATTSLTATRVMAPLSVVTGLITAFAGAPAVDAGAFVAAALLASVVAYASETGQHFVQASAYGDEQRFPLRPPFGYAVAAVVTWVVWAATVLAGPLLLAARSWIAGGLISVVAITLTVLLVPRWHRLSRRWLVLVPSGLVLHDPVVLGETLMLERSKIAGVCLARAGTEALDLTGPASGHAIEVSVTESVTALFSPTRAHPRGRAIHLTSYLAAPSRPGRALVAARDRRIPVG